MTRHPTQSNTPAFALTLRPAHELARLLRLREVGAVELLQLYLNRVERFNPHLNAVVVRIDDVALDRARAADAALARGEVWGPLHGVPITVKESFDLAGTPTTWGYTSLTGNVATQHAHAVQRLVDAGAIVFGKTNVPTSLADWQTFNPVYGTTNNPWDVRRVPGGSSGGSAAALAAGLCALELGSDIGASIRNPAHYCGVYGHKPTWGVVSMQGQQPPGVACMDAVDIGVVGPMARSAHDLALAMDVLASPVRAFGPHGWHPAAWRDPGTPPTRMRVAIVRDDPCAEVDATVQQALADLTAFLRARGVQVDEDVRPVDSRECYEAYIGLLRSATGAMLDAAVYSQALERVQRLPTDDRSYAAWVARASTLSHHGWVQHDQVRRTLQHQWAHFFERHDLLICPIATTPAFEHNQTGERWERMLTVNGKPQSSTDQLFWAGYAGVAGLPATAVPLATSQAGLPIGAQIIGPAFGDPMCLRFARWLEDEYRAFTAPPDYAQA
ncbi:MAG: amidase [Burkholderiales bacterium PBB5]|nr:MAG: amidase [Burkholderiales bacterium PBB5]